MCISHVNLLGPKAKGQARTQRWLPMDRYSVVTRPCSAVEQAIASGPSTCVTLQSMASSRTPSTSRIMLLPSTATGQKHPSSIASATLSTTCARTIVWRRINTSGRLAPRFATARKRWSSKSPSAAFSSDQVGVHV